MCTLVVSLIVIIGLYAIQVGRRHDQDDDNEMAALRTVTNDKYMPDMDFHAGNCPMKEPRTETDGKPVWVAGYPGSGFDAIAPLTAAVTGLTAVDIYRQHTCLKPLEGSTVPIAACMTHWPLVQKDSPALVAANDGVLYHHRAVFIIRNPAAAIPSYHTRWWGAQQHIRRNHKQPPEADWLEWRDKRFAHHLEQWKTALVEWQRGVPAAGVTGVGLYLQFEKLTQEATGPQLTADLADHLETVAHHEVVAHTSCLWRRVVEKDGLFAAKMYKHSFTVEQQQAFLSMLDELIAIYSITEPMLEVILQEYRSDIESNLRLDGMARVEDAGPE